MSAFTNIPILDLAKARNLKTKPEFLDELRHSLLEVGFLYLKNVGITDEEFERVKEEGKGFFDLPEEENRLNAEITAHAVDHREQFDLSTSHPLRQTSEPLYINLRSPNQWPSSTHLPRFQSTFTDYMTTMGEISIFFTSLIAEAIGLPANAFAAYFDADQQHKLKVVKYPDLAELGIEGDTEGQGVGPHKDSMLTSYLLQASEHKGLQVQNTKGEWIDCPPIRGTLVVAIGQGMEALTQGVCASTTHRVLSPPRGTGARFSIPFFQGVSLAATFEPMPVPEEVKEQRRRIIESNGGKVDEVEFTFKTGKYSSMGEATLMNRIKSHPDVGESWYPDLLNQIRRTKREKEKRREQHRKRKRTS